jgi:conjugal transfer/type IV secretion protein DotA/TraY
MSLFTVPTNDYVSHMMGMVFGSAWSTVQSLGLGAASSGSSATGYLGQMFLIYNTAILTVVTIYITKVLFEGAVGTAHKGEWFGKMYSTFWMPLRMFLMLGMLAPVLGGYCFGQVAVLFAVNTGIGVADDLANTGISAVIKTGVVSPPANVPSARGLVNGLFDIQTCVAIVNHDPKYNPNWPKALPSSLIVPIVSGNTIYFGGAAGSGLPMDACGSVSAQGLNTAQAAAYATLYKTITGMTSATMPIGQIMTSVYGSQGTGSNNTPNSTTNGTPVFGTTNNNLLTNAASTFEASLYSAAAPSQYSGETAQWASNVKTYGFAALAPLMLDISEYDNKLAAQVGQMPSVTAPSITYTRDGGYAYADAKRYTTNHNLTHTVSPALAASASPLPNLWKGWVAAPKPSLSEWLSHPDTAYSGFVTTVFTGEVLIPTDLLFRQVMADSNNPLGSVQNMGLGVINTGASVYAALGLLELTADGTLSAAGTSAGGFHLDPGPMADAITGLIGFLTDISFTPFIMFGVLLAYVLPMMPYTYMLLAVIGYVAAVAVAMVGAPLWIAAHAIPNGEGFVNEASKNGYRLLLSLFAKPALIVFGFFLSLAMFGAGVWLINQSFLFAMQVVLTGGESMSLLMVLDDVLGIIFMLSVLVSLYLTLAKWSFGLMNLVPDNALTWVGMQDISMGEERMADEATFVQAYGMSRSFTAAGKSAKQQAAATAVQAQQKEDQGKRDQIQADIASGLRSMSSGSGGSEDTGSRDGV